MPRYEDDDDRPRKRRPRDDEDDEDRPRKRRPRDEDEDDAEICASIIGLGRSLGLTIVAEGVETEEQLNWLRARGCDEIQGFLLGRPQPFEQLLDSLQAASATH